MSERWVAVLAMPPPYAEAAAPPGVDGRTLALAMLEDTIEAVTTVVGAVVAVVVVGDEAWAEEVGALTWPGTTLLRVEQRAAAMDGDVVAAAFDALAAAGAAQAMLIAPDCPDLPQLLIGKVFRALATAEVAVVPAHAGGLAALGARLPLPAWAAGVGLDDLEAFQELSRAAPRRSSIRAAPGWHRVRTPADVAELDPGLEGWDGTRAALAGSSGSSVAAAGDPATRG